MEFQMKMNVLLTAQLIILFLCYWSTNVHCRPRPKRQSHYRFKVIGNSSFPCEQVTTPPSNSTEGGTSPLHSEQFVSTAPISLSLDDLEILMKSKRTHRDHTFTARTKEETASFPNILPFSQNYTKNLRAKIKSEAKGTLTKAEVLLFLHIADLDDKIDLSPLPSENHHLIKKRNTFSDSESYCIKRGSPTADQQYLRMCTTCAITTDLGSKYYPSFINEANCEPNDNNCLVVQGMSKEHTAKNTMSSSKKNGDMIMTYHGKCQPITLPLNVLRKNDGYCILATKDGQTVVVEDWEPESRIIHVGCECTVDVNSIFSYFV